MAINPHFKPFAQPSRYKVPYGGRGSGKSWAIAELFIEIARRTRTKMLCTRELQNSIDDSVKQILEDTIYRLGYQDEFVILKTRIIHKFTGTVFLFYGLKSNITKIKSLEGVGFVWVEEAENISKDSWEILIPTIRVEGSEIWVSFNPGNILDETYQRFIINTPKDCILLKCNYEHNPHFPEVLRKEMEEMKEKDYDLYLHIWEGEPIADSEHAFIKPSWISAAVDAHKKLNFDNAGSRRTGYDVADEGEDTNALTDFHGSIVEHVEEWKKGDTVFSAKKVYLHAESIGSEIIYDSIGVGAGAKGKFNELNANKNKIVTCSGFNAGGAVLNPMMEYERGTGKTNKDMFANLKAQAWWEVRTRFKNTYDAVHNGRVYPVDQLISLRSDIKLIDKLMAELSRPRVDYDNNGRVKVESKKDMAKRGIPSPNLADSLIMAVANVKPPMAGLV